MITTVYDKPEETDPGDTLKRTNPQNYLKSTLLFFMARKTNDLSNIWLNAWRKLD